MDFIANSLREHQEIAMFLALAIGYLFGKITIGTFTFGPQIGSLLAGIVVSIWINSQGGPVVVPELAQNIFFSLFIFAMGFKVGPQFIQGVKGGGLVQVGLTVIFCTLALAFTYIMARIFSFDKGIAAGFMAGTFSQSATVGSAMSAINNLSVSVAEKKEMISNLAVAFAITNVIGIGGMPFWLSKVCPRFLRGDLKEECKKKEKELSIPSEREPGVFSALTMGLGRTYKITKDTFAGKKVSELELLYPGRIFVERIRKGNKIVESKPETIISKGDVVAISGFINEVFKIQEMIGEEIDDQELIDIQIEELNIVVTNKEQQNKTLLQLKKESERGFIRLVSLIRAGKEIPVSLETKVQRGDTLKVIGVKTVVEAAAKRLGFADRISNLTDISYICAGLVLGALIGLPAIVFKNVSLGLGTSVGILIMGIFLSWLRSTNPVFGRFPQAAIWIFESVGLSMFMAIVGLNSGPQFISGLLQSGIPILISGIITGAIPPLLCVLIGQYIFKLNMGINLGIAAGADTATPTINAITKEAKSSIPTLGFTIPYAIGNILLTLWGPVIVALVP
jgi:putative transport protein